MNIKQTTIDSLYELIRQCFIENRKFDRMVSVLGVNFVCNHSSQKIHQSVAHYFPQLSDQLGENCLERYDINVEYGETPEGRETYSSVSEIIQTMEDEVVNFQNMYIGGMKIAFANDDLQVYADMSHLLEDYNKIVGQIILLNDKIKLYGTNVVGFDHDIDSFWIL